MQEVITDNLDLWTSALLTKSTAGRGSNGKLEAYGIRKLRELILELAVRGKLVPQDANDEPASELLKRIQVEKTKLIAEGKIKKDKPRPPITDDAKPFDLPNGWAYSNLGDVVEIVRGITFPGNEKSKEPADGRIACLRTTNVQDQIEWDDILYIREKFVSREDQLLKPHDIVMSMANSRELVGKVALVGEKINQKTTFGGFLGVLRPFLIDPRFVMALLRTPHVREMLIDSASQTTNIANVSLAKLRPLFFAIPPLAEQHRIVAKVDELMVLCDKLEQQQTHSIEAHQTLVASLLGTLTRVESQQEFSAAWTRIASHFDILFTTEASIDQLKQTILQLAVMGKLVPQDPNDEPASGLLRRLFEARDSWLKECKEENPECATMLRKLKILGAPKAPFPLPETWGCAHLIQVSLLLVDCHNKTAPYSAQGIPIIRTSNIRERRLRMDDIKFVSVDTYNYWSRRCPPAPGDIIFTREAPMGEAAIIPQGALYCLGQRTMLIRPMHDHISAEYLLLTLTEPHLLERASEFAIGSTVKHLRVGDVENLNIPIPPLAEQHRIVAKVDELMALCDALKARLADAQAIQLHLADAVVEQAVC